MMKLGFYKSYQVVTAPVHYDSGPVGYSRKTYQQNRRRSDRERQKKEKKKNLQFLSVVLQTMQRYFQPRVGVPRMLKLLGDSAKLVC